MMKRSSFILIMMMLVLNAIAQTIDVGGVQRRYVTYVPQNLGAHRPLLISCHGMNQDTEYQRNAMVIESVADTAKFVTVFPQGINNSWDISGNRDINFILAIIDEMVDKYDIDPGRVYLSGFSMGGMFTYHAMNRIADRIAAFAPISGYTLSGVTAKPTVRPIPIIHTHGTSDDVVSFNNVLSNLDVWIQHNGCPSTAQVTYNYRGTPHITRHVWGPGNDGVEVVLMEMADKGHWISNDWGVKTSEEIWKFCSRYSIDVTNPPEKPVLLIDQRYAGMDGMVGKQFAIVNEADAKALYGSGDQNLGYEDYTTAFDDGNTGYIFKLENSNVAGKYLLRLMTPEGAEYSIWGKPGYLNSQPVTGWCSFILGLTKGNGEDMENGAVWDIQYEEGKGYTLRNVGTGLYLHDTSPAMFDTPAYFTFCTLRAVTGINEISTDSPDYVTYDLMGRRVNDNYKGIVIQNGKKYIRK